MDESEQRGKELDRGVPRCRIAAAGAAPPIRAAVAMDETRVCQMAWRQPTRDWPARSRSCGDSLARVLGRRPTGMAASSRPRRQLAASGAEWLPGTRGLVSVPTAAHLADLCTRSNARGRAGDGGDVRSGGRCLRSGFKLPSAQSRACQIAARGRPRGARAAGWCRRPGRGRPGGRRAGRSRCSRAGCPARLGRRGRA